MSRPVAYNLINKKLEPDISMAEMPEGSMGEGFFATKLGAVIGLARKNSIWPGFAWFAMSGPNASSMLRTRSCE